MENLNISVIKESLTKVTNTKTIRYYTGLYVLEVNIDIDTNTINHMQLQKDGHNFHIYNHSALEELSNLLVEVCNNLKDYK